MRPPVTLAIPQPCHENWAAMIPTTAGRHCAACQQTVVDFTLKTDAEILAYLARAANGRTCGRFAVGQLERPLQRPVPAAPTRWRTWLAAAVAVWGLREAAATAARAQAATECRPQYSGGPVPVILAPNPPKATAAQEAQAAGNPLPSSASFESVLDGSGAGAAAPVLRGIVTETGSGEPLPGCTVLIAGTRFGISTNAEGRFELPVPDSLLCAREITLTISSVGFVSQQRTLVARNAAVEQAFRLQADVKGLLGEVVVAGGLVVQRPWPWHPRRFYYWGKYWLAKPFRGR